MCNDGFIEDEQLVCHSCGDQYFDRKKRKCVRQCAAINISRNEYEQRTKYCEAIGEEECLYTASSICVNECQHFTLGHKCVEICPGGYTIDAASGKKTCATTGGTVLKVQDPMCQNMLKEYVYEPFAFCAVGEGFKESDTNITNVMGFNGIKYVDID